MKKKKKKSFAKDFSKDDIYPTSFYVLLKTRQNV